MSIAEEGTLVADARTRSFDVLPYHEYTAVREYTASVRIFSTSYGRMCLFHEAPTRLTHSFLRQGARMFSFLTNTP